MKSPVSQIQFDIVALVAIAYEVSLMAPDFHRKQLQRKCELLLKRYKVRKKKWPTMTLVKG